MMAMLSRILFSSRPPARPARETLPPGNVALVLDRYEEALQRKPDFAVGDYVGLLERSRGEPLPSSAMDYPLYGLVVDMEPPLSAGEDQKHARIGRGRRAVIAWMHCEEGIVFSECDARLYGKDTLTAPHPTLVAFEKDAPVTLSDVSGRPRRRLRLRHGVTCTAYGELDHKHTGCQRVLMPLLCLGLQPRCAEDPGPTELRPGGVVAAFCVEGGGARVSEDAFPWYTLAVAREEPSDIV